MKRCIAKMKKILLLLLMACSRMLIAQSDTTRKTYTTVVEGDTMPLVLLRTVDVVATLSPEAAAQLKAYYILRRDVLRTYPYAKYASRKLIEINNHVATLSSERQKKKYLKSTEKDLKETFSEDLKKLTINQGRILMKLIDRETGNTPYSLVKELRGGFRATLWQGVAKLFGENLKHGYDAAGDDKAIEAIVQQIETGQLAIPAAYISPKLQ